MVGRGWRSDLAQQDGGRSEGMRVNGGVGASPPRGLAAAPLVYRRWLLGKHCVVLHTRRGGSHTRADRDPLARIRQPVVLGVLRSAPSEARADD